MFVTYPPHPVLRPFVKSLWAIDGTNSARPSVAEREIVLPTGMMHLAVRLSDRPFRFFGGPDGSAECLAGHAVVAGARAVPYVRDIAEPAASVGAELHPGACQFLFGVPADEIAGVHTHLDDFWGGEVSELRERLFQAGTSENRLNVFEAFLATKLPRVRGVHPAVAHALDRFKLTDDVGEVVRETDFSHRRFIALFRQTVGLPPKLYCRVLRFRRVLARMASDPESPSVELAIETGYSDQPHFNREFRGFTGFTPGEYRKRRPASPHHVPIWSRNVTDRSG